MVKKKKIIPVEPVIEEENAPVESNPMNISEGDEEGKATTSHITEE